jgi:hypothetical protein
MTIPLELSSLIERLNQELEQIERGATEGLRLVRSGLSRFPDNAILIQFFASLNNFAFFVENVKPRIQSIVVTISPDDATVEEVAEAGEYLASLLGVVLEAKVEVDQILIRLAGWQ